MNTVAGLPLPKLSRGRFVHSVKGLAAQDYIEAWTDDSLYDACGVRIAFTERNGGESEAPYSSLNLKIPGISDTEQEAQCPDPHIPTNRRILTSAFGCENLPLICPNQVHKDAIVQIDSSDGESLKQAFQAAREGSDAVSISCDGVAALLCFADCVPLALVAPDASFAVVHCGWRGVALHLARKAFEQLVRQSSSNPADINIYIGAYIHHDCFVVSDEVAQIMENEFDASVLIAPEGKDSIHVDLGAALRKDLFAAGARESRIADMDICTACDTSHFFSYRTEDGVTGRHGVLAFRS